MAEKTARRDVSQAIVAIFRWVIPGVVIAGGIVAYLVHPSVGAAEGAAGVVGAGLSWLLFGFLYRVGEKGDHERDVENAARDYLDEHGHWPTDEEYGIYKLHGRWTVPA
jgi:hypothetical protein